MADGCPHCGAELPAGARFCPECGAALATPVGAERRLATMVFADLVGSTELAADRDPEELRALLAGFFDAARAVLEDYGGTVEKFIGDAVMAVFGAPRAYGDDPDRAVRASLALVRRVETLAGDLAVRIGVNTGEVLASPQGEDLSVTGSAVNVAARLQQHARPGQVLVGERTARACRAVVMREVDPVPAKGIEEPVRAFEAMEEHAEPPAPRMVAPLVGRDDDLELLRLVTKRAFREHVPQLVTVLGDAGIGKTRLLEELVAELRERSDAPRVLIGRNLPYGRGIAFWALGEILRQVAGTAADETPARVHDALEERLRELGAADADELAAVFAIALGGSASTAGPDGETRMEERLERAFRRLVGLLAAERPVVLVLDDAHWADDGLLDLVEAVTHGLEDAPIVALCASRPELLERRSAWGRGSRNATLLELRPLRPEEGDQLARELLPPEARHRAAEVAAAAGGNPFFEEEIARQVADSGAAHDGRLPDTVQAAIAARIDQLSPDEKRALQYAAVLGQSFRAAALASLLGDGPPQPLLSELVRKELLQERVADGADVYGFRHVLVRDVAYDSLPRSVRRELHERAAEWLDHAAGERHAELAEVLAFHLERAARLQPDTEREARAFEASATAAEAALRRGATARAQQLFEQAANHARSPGAAVPLLRSAAEVARVRFRGDEALRLYRAAGEAAEQAGDTASAAADYARVVETASRFGGLTADPPPLEELRELIERARKLTAPDAIAPRARLFADEAWLNWRSGDAEGMYAAATKALELARRGDNVFVLSGAYDAITAAEEEAGRLAEGVRFARERVELLDQFPPDSKSTLFERIDILSMLGSTLIRTADYEEALEWYLSARELELAHDLDWIAWSRGLVPRFFLGQWDVALADAREMRAAWKRARRPYAAFLSSSCAPVGAILGYRGDERGSEDWFNFTDELLGHRGKTRSWLLALRADVDLHHGCVDAATTHLETPAGERAGWWRSVYAATRAEALVRADRDDGPAALGEAEAWADADRYAQGVNLRTRGLLEGSEARLREAHALFTRIGVPYQAARTGLLIGGDVGANAEATYRQLGLEVEAAAA